MDDCGGWGWEVRGELDKVFEVGFVERISNDFDVEFVELGGGETVFEIGC